MEDSCDGLAKMACIPCQDGVPPLPAAEWGRLLEQLGRGWRVVDNHLEKSFAFPDFRSALDFAIRIGDVAEREGHHPDLHLSWGKVGVRIWTHTIDGLTESDFVLAAKIETLPAGGCCGP